MNRRSGSKRRLMGYCELCQRDQDKAWYEPIRGSTVKRFRTFRTGPDGITVCDECDCREYGRNLPSELCALFDANDERVDFSDEQILAQEIEHLLLSAAGEKP